MVNHALSPSDRRRMYSLYPRPSRRNSSTPRRRTSARTRPRMGWDASSPSSLSEASERTFQLILFRRRFIILLRAVPGANCSWPGACAILRTPFWPLAEGATRTRARGVGGGGRAPRGDAARGTRRSGEGRETSWECRTATRRARREWIPDRRGNPARHDRRLEQKDTCAERAIGPTTE